MTTTIRRCGEAALLLDCADLAHAVALAQELDGLRPDAVDVVPAARTVLVTARDASALPVLRARIEQLLAPGADESAVSESTASSAPPLPPPPPDRRPSSGIGDPHMRRGPGGRVADSGVDADLAGAAEAVTIDVRYDGPDLADVADHAELSVEELVRRHTSITWRAAFGGFAPGFFYLVDARELAGGRDGGRDGGPDGERELAGALPVIPRLPTPRPRVEAGSVALADRFCAVYPGVSPGGWRLIGSTDARLWDLDRPEPALLAPGVAVRFRDADGARGGGA